MTQGLVLDVSQPNHEGHYCHHIISYEMYMNNIFCKTLGLIKFSN
jgi:hypothetical protein